MVTTENFLHFSLKSYSNEISIGIDGFRVFMDSSKHQYINNGYYGIAFINDMTKEVIIVSRGTGNGANDVKYPWNHLHATNLEDLANDLYKDYEILLGKLPATFLDQELKFAKLVIYSLENYKSYQFSFTGHSYGAIVAEVSHILLSQDLDINSKAVTFDSPGSAPIIREFFPNIQFPISDITIYNSQPNIVNTCNQQAGHTYLIRNDKDYIEIPKEFNINSAAASFVEFLKLTSSRHNIEKMLSAVDPLTSEFLYSKKIKKWPILAEGLRENLQKSFSELKNGKNLADNFMKTASQTWDCFQEKFEDSKCLQGLIDFGKTTVNMFENIEKLSETGNKIMNIAQEAINYLGIYKLDYNHDEL